MSKPNRYIWCVCLFHLSSLMLMNVQSIKRARSIYAVSCITSPGGKHRGLAGSVAVLIAESLLMWRSPYTRCQTKSTSFLNVFFAGGVTQFRCTDGDTCLLTTSAFEIQDGGGGLFVTEKARKKSYTPVLPLQYSVPHQPDRRRNDHFTLHPLCK